MRPKWFTHDAIPYDSMWPDDKLWYPMMLGHGHFDAYFKFRGHDVILESSINEKTINGL